MLGSAGLLDTRYNLLALLVMSVIFISGVPMLRRE